MPKKVSALRVIRVREGWGIGEIADAVGVSPNTIRNWEIGRTLRPRKAARRRLGELLAVDEMVLFPQADES